MVINSTGKISNFICCWQRNCEFVGPLQFPIRGHPDGLLDRGLLSQEYVQSTIYLDDSVAGLLWTASANMGHERAIRRFAELGVPMDLNIIPFTLHRFYCFAPADQNTAMGLATELHNLGLYRVLVELGADVNARITNALAKQTTPLISSVQYSPLKQIKFEVRLQLVRELIEEGANIHAVDAEGRDAFSHAAGTTRCPPDILQLLLDNGADPNTLNTSGRTSIHYAALWHLNLDFLETICACPSAVDLDVPDQEGFTPFLIAAEHSSPDRIDLVTFFLQKGANPTARLKDGRNALHILEHNGKAFEYDRAGRYGDVGEARRDHTEMLELLAGSIMSLDIDESHIDPYAVCFMTSDRSQALSILFSAGADLNNQVRRDMPALYRVCWWPSSGTPGSQYPGDMDHPQSIKILVRNGARATLVHSYETLREQNITVIGLAASCVHGAAKLPALELLLEKAGAEPGGNDVEGCPALLSLCSTKPVPPQLNNSLEDHQVRQCIELLVSYGADMTIKDDQGQNCFHHTARSNNSAAMLVCLSSIAARSSAAEARAMANLSDSSGNTPLHFAAQESCLDVLELYFGMPEAEVLWSATNNNGETAADLADGDARTRILTRQNPGLLARATRNGN